MSSIRLITLVFVIFFIFTPTKAQYDPVITHGIVTYTDELEVGQIHKWEYSIQNDTYVYVDDGDTIEIEVMDLDAQVGFEDQSNRSPRIFLNDTDFDKKFYVSSTHKEDWGYVSEKKMIYPLMYTFVDGSQISMLDRLTEYHDNSVLTEIDDLLHIDRLGRYESNYVFNMTNGILIYFRAFDVVDQNLLEINYLGIIDKQISDNNITEETSDSISNSLIIRNNVFVAGILTLLVIKFVKFNKKE